MILNIGSKKISIICIFYKADKPTVDILSVYSSCSGFSVEVTESRGGDVEGVLYSPGVCRGEFRSGYYAV